MVSFYEEGICGHNSLEANGGGKEGEEGHVFLGTILYEVGSVSLLFVGGSNVLVVHYHLSAPHPYTVLLSLRAHDFHIQHKQILWEDLLFYPTLPPHFSKVQKYQISLPNVLC